MRRILIASFFLLFGPGCKAPTLACADHADCPDHQGCLAGVCLDATCRTSDDCAFGETCFELACEPGCRTDVDCGAGRTCEPDGTCADARCEVTTLDCPTGTRCISDGTCSRQDDVCQPCGDTGLCPDPGDRCIAFTETEAYCVQRCRDTSDCPAAFSCMPLEGGISVCVGDCGWLRDEGWL